jgi:hypothetical protein
LDQYSFPSHGRSLKDGNTYATYKEDIDDILDISANLTDRQKALAEFFDHKLNSLGMSVVLLVQNRKLTVEEFVYADLTANIAAFDTVVLVWREKAR